MIVEIFETKRISGYITSQSKTILLDNCAFCLKSILTSPTWRNSTKESDLVSAFVSNRLNNDESISCWQDYWRIEDDLSF